LQDDAQLQDDARREIIVDDTNNNGIRCPRCNSNNIQCVTETVNSASDFGARCLGFILMGPLSLLCGPNQDETKRYCICNHCGEKFQNNDCDDKTNGHEQMDQIDENR